MRRWRLLVAATLTAGLGLTGCAPGAPTTNDNASAPASAPATTPSESSSPTASPTPTATLTLSSPMGVTSALPADPITLAVDRGTLDTVSVTQAGKKVAGEFKDATWTPKDDLDFDTDYLVSVTTQQGDRATATFHTAPQEQTAAYRVLYLYNNMGVGMPAYVKFASAVPKDLRADIEKRAIVTTEPAQEGSWGWLSDTELLWRPKTFWEPGTKISLDLKWAGVPAGKGKRLPKSVLGTYSISKTARIIKVDSASHSMTVTENGQVVKTFPITTGKEGFITRSGTKIVLEKEESTRMASETIGISGGNDYYDLQVKWAMRVTWTGEFIHAAPWSVSSQGKANVSHGCVGMSDPDAQWLFERTRMGDVVEFVGTDRPMKPSEGIGVWLYSWDDWRTLSAAS